MTDSNKDKSISSEQVYSEDLDHDNSSIVSRVVNSFKPAAVKPDLDISQMSDLEKANYFASHQPLQQSLKSRHLFWLAIGGVLGSGIFVSSGYNLSIAGPGGLLVGYVIVAYAILCVVLSLAEIATQFTVAGSFISLFGRFLSPAFNWVFGLVYALSWLISLPSELVAIALTIQYWNDSISPSVWVAIFYVLIVVINLFGVKAWGETEFILSIIKVLAVIGFIILGICIICGVGDQGYIGARYWHNPGSFNNGFKGVCSSFISAAFTFGGTELVAIASSETKNPRKSLPKATKQVFWRITLFYIVSAIIIGFLVPSNDDLLLNGSGVSASPFVIAVSNGGIKVVPHIMNAVVLSASFSVGNSCVYGCSRVLASMAVQEQGFLPRIFGYVDRKGRPLVAIIFTCLIGLLGFLVESANEGTVFTWLFSVCSLSSFFTWAAICVTHIRFRRALYIQGRSLDEVIFVSPMGLVGSITGVIILGLIIIAEIWISIWPIGQSASVSTFWQNCLSLPLMIVMWFIYNIYNKSFSPLLIDLKDIDLDSGRRDWDVELLKQELAEERLQYQSKPFYYKLYKFFC
ncbi:amino acid permease [Hyphopichia burtonii NRRL Y-1933]|uniref:Amino acid permease n=1 Tax=Hyphopichia burtonii NRRL Y-1933 TaxID=984485 RepID=A0A1E4RBK0_9ASCO|nr:amino acid permease [Hyphopichia burtonii NRRL Y-1933]ODV64644.1 amino acid permease [Hyphopichia burtonii NRRL Y-1933]